MVVALDMSPGMLEAVGVNAPDAVRLLADGHALPLRDDSVDVVIAAWVLYHLNDKPSALAEIARVLQPKGRLVAATNSAEAFPGLDKLLHDSVEETLGRTVERWIEPLDFTLENGADILATTFDSVERLESATQFALSDSAPVVALAASLQDPIQAEVGEPTDEAVFLGAVRRRVEAQLAVAPIEFTKRVAFFTASGAVSN